MVTQEVDEDRLGNMVKGRERTMGAGVIISVVASRIRRESRDTVRKGIEPSPGQPALP